MLGSHSKWLEDLSLVQCERLAYINFRLYFSGEIGRPDLIECLGVAPAGATRDLAWYREIAPHNITFDGSNKIYRIGQEFSPLFENASLRVLSALSLGFSDGVNGSIQALLPCESPASKYQHCSTRSYWPTNNRITTSSGRASSSWISCRTSALRARYYQDGLRDDRWLDQDARSRFGGGLYVAALAGVLLTRSLPSWTVVPVKVQRSSRNLRRKKCLTGTRL